MKKFKFNISGNQYDVKILHNDGNTAEVEVNGTTYTVEIEREVAPTKTPILVRPVAVPSTDMSPSNAKTSSPSATKGGGHIKSPLPGVVLEMCVKVGDSVVLGQKLLVLEAMKMENNIDSDKEGTITDIKVRNGDSVMEGDTLIVIG